MCKRILLVDDDIDYLAATRLQLEAAGYEVIVAESPGEARERLAAQKPDAAIVDLMMEAPDDGFALCYHIKKADPAIPVILVTAVTSETGIEFDATTGEDKAWIKADALLAKPVRFEQLQHELRRLSKTAREA
jgi:CheY-like chemotaxis protein